MILRISDWNEIYENNRTKELKHMTWVPVPNKMDGDGYTELVDHPDGAAHFGAWLAIVQIASKCDTRGTLLRDRAEPHTAASLARISRLPREVFEEALPRLLVIGWLELIALDPQQDPEISHDPAEIPQEMHAFRKGMELHGTERLKASSKSAKSELDEIERWFDEEFWPAFWRRVQREHSLKIFRKHATSEAKKNVIIAAVKAHAPQYERRDPEHRPHAATWLNKKQYLEPPEDLTALPIRPQPTRRSVMDGV